jgi:hypothetical protein
MQLVLLVVVVVWVLLLLVVVVVVVWVLLLLVVVVVVVRVLPQLTPQCQSSVFSPYLLHVLYPCQYRCLVQSLEQQYLLC